MDRRTLLGTILAGSALGCAGPLGKAEAAAAMNPAPRLTLNAAIADGKLRLDYVVENLSSTDLYLYRGLSDLDRILTSPGVAFAASDKLLTVYRVPTQPATYRAAPLTVLMTLLRAGSQFRERIELDLPVREDESGPSCRERPNAYHGIRFSTEFVWHFPGVRIERIKIRDVEWDQPIFPLVRMLPSGPLTSDVVPLDIPVVECAET